MFNKSQLSGLWSASPTPFTTQYELDRESIIRLADHHAAMGVHGVFICGSCGEGPYLTNEMQYDLAKQTVKATNGRMQVAIQVTDNSTVRILENIKRVEDTGVDIAVIATPYDQVNPSRQYMKKILLDAIDQSPIPIGIYYTLKRYTEAFTKEIVSELACHENVVLIKDSSNCQETRDLFIQTRDKLKKESLFLLNGNEFDCVSYLQAGYDGLLLGGCSFNGFMEMQIMKYVKDNELEKASELQRKMSNLMYDTFGGKTFSSWLTGQKKMMVELGVFTNSETVINYELTPELEKSIKSAFQREKKFLVTKNGI